MSIQHDRVQHDRVHVRTTKMNLRRKKRTMTVNQTLSRNFTLDELEIALMSLKPGKAAGFDGIYPEFMKNFGAQTKEWIISFMNDIVSTSKIPNLFKRAKVIAIIKPGKDGTDPAHYRPISLLNDSSTHSTFNRRCNTNQSSWFPTTPQLH
jgi:hypothetical protein